MGRVQGDDTAGGFGAMSARRLRSEGPLVAAFLGPVLLAVATLVVAGTSASAHHLTTVHPVVFPVDDPDTIFTPDFLAPRGGGTRQHAGNDLFNDKMTPLVAAADGTVVRASFADVGTGGNFVVIEDAAGWEYVYVHLNNDTPGTDDDANLREYIAPLDIEVGVEVTAGQVVGYLGDSGNAEETPPHLHFEMKRPDGVKINPWPSLRTTLGEAVGDQCVWSRNPTAAPDDDQARGLWTVTADGVVTGHGGAPVLGGTGDVELNASVLGMTGTRSGDGYWLVASDGGIFSFGDAAFHGSTGDLVLAEPVVGMAATPGGGGYWLVAADGGIFAFGDAGFHGSVPGALPPGAELAAPVVGIVPTESGDGYWLVAADGGIFAFGDAGFVGSLPGAGVDDLALGVAGHPDGNGYWVLNADGGVYAFGDAEWHGSVQSAGHCLTRAGADIAPTPSGGGYWILTTDGRVFPFGDAPDVVDPTRVAAEGDPAVALTPTAPGLDDPPPTTTTTASTPEPDGGPEAEDTTTTTVAE